MQPVMDDRRDSTTEPQPKHEQSSADEAEKNQEKQLDEGTETPG